MGAGEKIVSDSSCWPGLSDVTHVDPDMSDTCDNSRNKSCEGKESVHTSCASGITCWDVLADMVVVIHVAGDTKWGESVVCPWDPESHKRSEKPGSIDEMVFIVLVEVLLEECFAVGNEVAVVTADVVTVVGCADASVKAEGEDAAESESVADG